MALPTGAEGAALARDAATWPAGRKGVVLAGDREAMALVGEVTFAAERGNLALPFKEYDASDGEVEGPERAEFDVATGVAGGGSTGGMTGAMPVAKELPATTAWAGASPTGDGDAVASGAPFELRRSRFCSALALTFARELVAHGILQICSDRDGCGAVRPSKIRGNG